MRWMAAVAAVGLLAVSGCGSDGEGGDGQGGSVQEELADLIVEDAAFDDECVRSKTAELSDDQAQFLIDDIDAERSEEFDADLQVWVNALAECVIVPDATGDRGRFDDEVDGVRAAVADCFITEASDGSRHYSTTVEIDNGSDAARLVTVTVESDLGWGGVSDTFEVPSGGRDAWGVISGEATTDEVGDVECADYINGIAVTVDTP